MEPSGVLIINKSAGMTSHDVVNKIRRLFGTKRVGHTGTLDPLATGVLVILVGRAAKAAEYLSSDRKGYLATLRLGITTDTEDITGNVLSSHKTIPSFEALCEAAKRFEGEIMQTPPMYSALKVNGQKLCDLARKGITVEREARRITVHSIKCSKAESETDFLLNVECSAGTYIRTLCADIGTALGCGGAMATLCRTFAGGFSINEALTLEDIEKIDLEQRFSLLKPIEKLFSELPCVKLPPFYEKLSKSGCEIYQKKIHTDLELGTRVRICDANGIFYALGEVRQYEDGTAIKSIKLFDI